MVKFTIDKLNPVLENFLSSPSYEPQPFSNDFIPPCDYFPNCKDSKVNIGLNNWYDSDYFKERVKGYKIEYPDRELFLVDLNKKIYYTIDCINRLINKQNGENEIIKYIIYIYVSFGSTGTKINIGWHFYLLFLYRFLPNIKSIRNGDITVQKRVDKIKDFLSEHIDGKSGKINEQKRQLVTNAVEKWVKAFPFELDVIKEYKFSPSYPVFTITQNPYNPRAASIYYHNESEVLKSLIRQTNELIDKVNFYDLMEKGIITNENIDEQELELWKKNSEIQTNELLNKFTSGEMNYVEILKKWYKISENNFEKIRKHLERQKAKPQQIETHTQKLKMRQIALIHVYNGEPITENGNANEIAKKYGHNSGKKLYSLYCHYTDKTNRIGTDDTKRKSENRVKLLESVIEHLTKNTQKLKDEISTLKANIAKEYPN